MLAKYISSPKGPIASNSKSCVIARSVAQRSDKAISERTTNMRLLFVSIIIMLSGCATASMSEYISRVDHPYDKVYYASIEKVTGAIVYVLRKQGWTISSEADPATYERDDRYENNGYKNLLILTDVKKKFNGAYLSSMHLNIFIHSLANTCDVEIRYEAKGPFTSLRNDPLVQGLLDAIEQDVDRR